MTLAQIGTDVYLPSLPDIKWHFGISNTETQLTITYYLIGFAFSQLFYGPLSDRYGRKPFLLLGTATYCMMSFVAANATSINTLLIARGLQGLGGGACSVIPRAIMRDHFTGKELEKIVIYQSMVWSIIPITMPLIGSYIQHFLGWRYNFLFLASISFVSLILCFLFQESHQQKEKQLSVKNIIKEYKNILMHKQFVAHLICSIGIVGSSIAFNVTAPLIIRETLHLSTLQYGWSIFFVAVSFIFGISTNRWLLGKYSSLLIVKYGLIASTLCSLLLILFGFFSSFHLLEFLIPIFFLEIGCALVFPSNAAKAMELFPHIAGKAAAIFGCSVFLGASLSSAIISLFSVRSLLPLGIFLAIANMMMIFAYRNIVNHHYSMDLGIPHKKLRSNDL